jgi:hypothetical protein
VLETKSPLGGEIRCNTVILLIVLSPERYFESTDTLLISFRLSSRLETFYRLVYN